MATTQATARGANVFAPAKDEKKLSPLVVSTTDLPAMPLVAAKILELSADPATSAVKLQQIIADDQAMTARILKVANSAVYSHSRRIKTLSEAADLLGFDSVRSLAVTGAARNLYDTGSAPSGLKERLMWEHSIGCALACRLLVEQRLPEMAEEAFLAGLLHDIGKLALAVRLPESFDAVVQAVYGENLSFVAAEHSQLGFDHAQVGSLLVNSWNLSPDLEYVVRHHHDTELPESAQPLLLYLDLGNRLCHRLGIGFAENGALDLVDSPSNMILGLPPEVFHHTARVLQETLEHELEVFI